MQRTIGIGLAAGALLALLACRPSERTEVPKTQAPTAPAAAPSPAEPALGPGESRVEVGGDGVTVVCQSASRGLLLEKLSRAVGFELRGDVDSRPLTLDLRGQPLEQVLPAILLDLPYRAQWRVEGDPSRHVLVQVELGEPEAIAKAQAQAQQQEKAKGRGNAIREKLRAMREETITDEQRAEIAARREERARSQADMLEQVRSSNPEMRIEAVKGLDPEGATLPTLVALLAEDPDPRVRRAVAEQLGESDGYAAVGALVAALNDPDPAVVLQVLDSLEFVGDETIGPILKASCLNHPDAKVREACAEASEFVE